YSTARPAREYLQNSSPAFRLCMFTYARSSKTFSSNGITMQVLHTFEQLNMSLLEDWVEYLSNVGDISQGDSYSPTGKALVNELKQSISGWPRHELIGNYLSECVAVLESFKKAPSSGRMTNL